MKRKLGLFMTVMVVFLTACGQKTPNQGENTPVSESTVTPVPTQSVSQNNTAKEKGYLLVYEGVTIGIDMEASGIITALGEPDSYFEAASCAFEGLDKMYTYGSIEIDTYEMDGKDYISSILFKDDMVATKEGVSLFMTKADMTAAYGEAYTEEFGMLVYAKDGMKLRFILTGDEITSIEYTTTILDAQ